MAFPEQLQSLSAEIIQENAQSVETGLARLNKFLRPLASNQAEMVEWGCPHGSFGRLIPALLTRSLLKKCLWIYDKKELFVYPNSWKDLGFDLNAIHFIRADKALKELRPAFSQDCYKLIIIDSAEFLKAPELRYLFQCSKKLQSSIFLLRPFFLSNKNGNPFFKYRINSSYDLKRNSFDLSFVKGSLHKRLHIAAHEIFA